MKKMVTTSSDFTDSTQSPIDFLLNSSEETLALNEGTHRIRCSAFFTLAISMGASSFWVVNPTQSAFAAEILTYQTTSVEKNDQNPSLILIRSTQPLKHEVKLGETLFSLSQNYHIEPEAIAQVNNITLQTDLQIGQTITIPTSENQSSSRPEKLSSSELDQSLDNLKQSRRKLQESLAALRSNQITEQPSLIAQTPVSSQEEPIKSVNDPINEIDESSSLAIELNRPIPIVVPTPETEITELRVEPTLIQASEVTPTTMPDTVASYQPIPVDESYTEEIRDEQTAVLQTPKLITPTHDTFYQVQVGDTLKTIAESHGISIQALAEANQITDPNMLKVDQSLIIPSNSEQSTFKSQLPPVPQVKPISTSVVATNSETSIAVKPSQATEFVQPEAVNLAVESPTQTQTEKLREDFAYLEQSEQTSTHSEQVSVSIPINANGLETRPQTRNSEWDNSNSALKKPQNIETRPTIVGTASIQVEPYIDNLKIPVGTTVDPEFPALSNPNEYLPETQPIFQGFIWPAKGVLTSGYGRRWGKMHRGIDIAAPIGTPVIAAAPGQVVSSGFNNGGYGNLVKVKHADGSVTLYAHNSRLLVRSGQQVQQGQQIAQMGSTGFSTGPHLHFEVHRNGQGAVNPIAFLPKKERR